MASSILNIPSVEKHGWAGGALGRACGQHTQPGLAAGTFVSIKASTCVLKRGCACSLGTWSGAGPDEQETAECKRRLVASALVKAARQHPCCFANGLRGAVEPKARLKKMHTLVTSLAGAAATCGAAIPHGRWFLSWLFCF